MRILKLATLAVLGMGVSSYAGFTNMKTGISAQTSVLDDAGYRPAVGVNGFVGTEHATGYGAGGMGVRANFDNYRLEGGTSSQDIQEGGVSLTASGGPSLSRFQPRLGGHVGYARLEQSNYLDLGPDVTAALMMNKHIGLNALVTPTWFINGDKTDFLGTKMGLGVTWNIPGA